MPSKLKQRRVLRFKADVAWWWVKANDLHSRVMDQADEITELRHTMIPGAYTPFVPVK